MVRRFLIASAILGLVAGCAKPLTANDMPRPKAGLWTWVNVVNGAPFGKGQTCLAGKPVHLLGPACPQITYDRASDGAFETENRCDNGVVSDFKDRFSGDFRTSYVMDQTGTLAQPGKPLSIQASRVTYTFVGPCPAGVAPDDD